MSRRTQSIPPVVPPTRQSSRIASRNSNANVPALDVAVAPGVEVEPVAAAVEAPPVAAVVADASVVVDVVPAVVPVVPVADGDAGGVADGDSSDEDVAFADGGADMHNLVWHAIGRYGGEPFIFNPDFDPMRVGGSRPISTPFKNVGFMSKYT